MSEPCADVRLRLRMRAYCMRVCERVCVLLRCVLRPAASRCPIRSERGVEEVRAARACTDTQPGLPDPHAVEGGRGVGEGHNAGAPEMEREAEGRKRKWGEGSAADCSCVVGEVSRTGSAIVKHRSDKGQRTPYHVAPLCVVASRARGDTHTRMHLSSVREHRPQRGRGGGRIRGEGGSTSLPTCGHKHTCSLLFFSRSSHSSASHGTWRVPLLRLGALACRVRRRRVGGWGGPGDPLHDSAHTHTHTPPPLAPTPFSHVSLSTLTHAKARPRREALPSVLQQPPYPHLG